MGKAGDYYIKGWDKEDEKRLENAEAETTINDRSNKKPVNYLNDSGDLY